MPREPISPATASTQQSVGISDLFGSEFDRVLDAATNQKYDLLTLEEKLSWLVLDIERLMTTHVFGEATKQGCYDSACKLLKSLMTASLAPDAKQHLLWKIEWQVSCTDLTQQWTLAMEAASNYKKQQAAENAGGLESPLSECDPSLPQLPCGEMVQAGGAQSA